MTSPSLEEEPVYKKADYPKFVSSSEPLHQASAVEYTGTFSSLLLQLQPTPNMKPSILTLTAVFAMSGVGESRKWDCQSVGKGRPSNQKLKDAVWDFDRLFGKNLLTAKSNQCYVSKCRGHYFAFCNTAGVTRKEKKGHRGQVKDKGLPRGQADSCNVSVGDWIADSYNVYHFGSLKGLSKDSCFRKAKCGVFRNDIRTC